MYDKFKNLLNSFDEIFNDNFIENATEEEMELRFEYFKNLCAKDRFKIEELLDELEFNCNSYIHDIVHDRQA